MDTKDTPRSVYGANKDKARIRPNRPRCSTHRAMPPPVSLSGVGCSSQGPEPRYEDDLGPRHVRRGRVSTKVLLTEPDQLTLGLLTLGWLTLSHCQRAPALVGPTCSGSKSATPTTADLNPLLTQGFLLLRRNLKARALC